MAAYTGGTTTTNTITTTTTTTTDDGDDGGDDSSGEGEGGSLGVVSGLGSGAGPQGKAWSSYIPPERPLLRWVDGGVHQ